MAYQLVDFFFFFELPVWNQKMLYYFREAHLQRKVLKQNRNCQVWSLQNMGMIACVFFL